jgi:hypothetical protein
MFFMSKSISCIANIFTCATAISTQSHFSSLKTFQTITPQLGDFSFAIPPQAPQLSKNFNSEKLLPKIWIQEIGKSFQSTSVGDAFLDENQLTDWRLVSVRIAPCVPLLATSNAENFCWPEIRQVWQPFSKNNFNSFFADDRAIHILQDVLPPEIKSRAESLMLKIKSSPQNFSTQEKEEFEKLKKETQAYLLKESLLLRNKEMTESSLQSVDERAEFSVSESAKQAEEFLSTLFQFLSKNAFFNQAKKVTAFSLPAGKQPAGIDEWVFVAFEPQKDSSLKQLSQFVQSRTTGRQLSPSTLFTRGTQMHEDSVIEDFLVENPLPLAKEVHDRTLFSGHDTPEIRENISNPIKSNTFNVTCISCHKLNDLKFNFHNFSYLEDFPLSVSPRVKLEAAQELKVWRNLLLP